MFGGNGAFWTLLTGIAAACILGYCLYFDQKRCSAEDYKRRVRERRRKGTLPKDLKYDTNEEQLKRFFVSELQMGDSLIANGDIFKGIDHFVNATLLSGRPAPMIQLFQTRLPPQLFEVYIHRMHEVRHKIMSDEREASEHVAGDRPELTHQ